MLTLTLTNIVAAPFNAPRPPSWVYCCVDSRRPELETPALTLPGGLSHLRRFSGSWFGHRWEGRDADLLLCMSEGNGEKGAQ